MNENFYLQPLLPEIEEGNIEYKRQIDDLTPDKIIKFKTQMIWRMSEGKKISGVEEAIYYIGIDDNGTVSGVSIQSINKSLINFATIVKLYNAEIHSTKIEYTNSGPFAIVHIKKLETCLIKNEIKIALLGSTNYGKTTLLGVLTYDLLDDGDGSTRRNILRHFHEKQNGNTSSIKCEIIGYDDSKFLNYNSGFIGSWEYIVKNSKKIINFVDLPGNIKYLKTTLFGLMAHKPNYIFVFIGLSNIFNKNDNTVVIDEDTKLYINLCIKFNFPFSIILTKKDTIDEIFIPKIIEEIQKIVINKKLKICINENDINDLNDSYDNFIPTIFISNISGENINVIKSLLKKIKNNKNEIMDIIDNKYMCEFMINDVFFVNDVGIVVSGIVNNGRIKIGDKLLIGPLNKTFYNVKIDSIHKKQIPCKYLTKNEIGSLVIKTDSNLDITKNLLIVSSNQLSNFINKFKILIVKENYFEIKKNSVSKIFCRNIYDNIIIEDIQEKNDHYLLDVRFTNSNIQFLSKDEFIVIRHNNLILVGNIII